MKNKGGLLLLVLLLHFFANAQETNTIGDLKVFESQAFKEKEKTDYILSFNKSESGKTVLLRGTKRKLILDVFGADFSKSHTKSIKREKKKEWYIGALFYDDYLKFFTVYKPKKRERVLYCHTLNLNDFTYEKKELFKKELEKGGSLFYSIKKKETNVAISPNHKYFVIATNNSTKKINSSTVYVYDTEDLSLVYTKSYQTHEENKYTHNSISIDDNATVYSLGKINTKSFVGTYSSSNKEQREKSLKKKKNSKSKYEFVLNQIDEYSVKDMSIELDSIYVRSLTISKVKDKLNLFGFYSEKHKGRIKGGCSFVIDKESFSIVRKKRDQLPLEVFEGLYGNKRAAKKKKKAKELKNFYIDYVLEDEEGATYVLAEEFYITSVYVATTTGGYWRDVPHYDDILIVKFNKTGDLEWGRGIYKKDGTPSYNAFLKSNKLHVVLNTGRNLKKQKNGRTKLSKSFFGLGATALYDFSYTKSGEVARFKIQDNKTKGTTKYQPYLGAYVNKKFMMMSISKFKRRFMVLE